MSVSNSKIKVHDAYDTFSLRISNPIEGIKSVEEKTTGLVRAIIAGLSKHHDGIEELIGSVLELDSDDYDVVISGTPRDTSQLGGKHVEYMLTMSIFPRVDAGKSKGIR